MFISCKNHFEENTKVPYTNRTIFSMDSGLRKIDFMKGDPSVFTSGSLYSCVLSTENSPDNAVII